MKKIYAILICLAVLGASLGGAIYWYQSTYIRFDEETLRRDTTELTLTGETLPELELLIAGHHGSKNATSESLLSLTSPEYVFISAGENNRYGHPSKEVLERLERHGCAVYRTDRQGDLIFRR